MSDLLSIQAQITAAEAILRPHIHDPSVSVASLVLQVVNAFQSAAPKETKKAKPESAKILGFDAFYAAYPRREARRDAEKAYEAALNRSTPELILAGAKRYASGMKETERRYIKLPATWLRADCWKDELGNLKLAPGTEQEREDKIWYYWVSVFYEGDDYSDLPKGHWPSDRGAKPGQPGCKAPAAILARFSHGRAAG